MAGTQASDQGLSELAKLPLGQYVLRATAMGYRTGRRVISLTTNAPALKMGILRLGTTTQFNVFTLNKRLGAQLASNYRSPFSSA